MTSPSEIPDALREKARVISFAAAGQVHDNDDAKCVESLVFQLVEAALLAVRNEAIAEEREACAAEAVQREQKSMDEIAAIGSDAYWQGSASSAAMIAAAIRARA